MTPTNEAAEHEQLRQDFNAAVANGLVTKARQIERHLAAFERQASESAPSPDPTTDAKNALGRAIHSVFRHSLHGGGPDSADGGLALAILDELAESGFSLAAPSLLQERDRLPSVDELADAYRAAFAVAVPVSQARYRAEKMHAYLAATSTASEEPTDANRQEDPATKLRDLRDYANVLRFDQGALDSDQWRYLHFCIDQYAIEREAQGEQPAPLDVERPRVVCICGSTRFAEHMNTEAERLTLAGHIVVRPEVVAYNRERDQQFVEPDVKAALDELHLRKIDLADEVVVVTVNGYVGESTRREIAYAERTGKPIRFAEYASPSNQSSTEPKEPTDVR